jgi:hypothetical protein
MNVFGYGRSKKVRATLVDNSRDRLLVILFTNSRARIADFNINGKSLTNRLRRIQFLQAHDQWVSLR